MIVIPDIFAYFLLLLFGLSAIVRFYKAGKGNFLPKEEEKGYAQFLAGLIGTVLFLLVLYAVWVR